MTTEVVGRWRVDLPKGFRRTATPDALQFTDGNLICYFSELVVASPGGGSPPPASELHEKMRSRAGGHYELAESGEFGYARLQTDPDSHQLVASREGTESILTVVVTFSDERDLDAALRIWRSARYATRLPDC